MNRTEIMETSNDFIHTSVNKNMVLIGDKIKKSWILLPKELGNKKVNVIETIDIKCLCESHLSTLYILDSKYSTFYCPNHGWAWIEQPRDLILVKKYKKLNI